MQYYLGVDIGGTFTDAVLVNEAGEPRFYKVPTTPAEPSVGVNDAIAKAAEELGIPAPDLLSEIAYFGLGTTVATNAFIERKGVKTGLITTRGFRDGLLMQRTTGQWAGMGDDVTHYSARCLPAPIVPRRLIEEVSERTDYKGAAVVGLDEDDAYRAVRRLLDDQVEAIAICFLWSFRNPANEQRLREIVQELAPDVFVTISSELAPVIGEYERSATTAINAYLGPTIRRYMVDLETSLAREGLAGPLRILDSGGGVISADDAGKQPVSILTSGPTGGVLASVKLAETLEEPNVITTDMGGTSFDVSLVVDGRALIAARSELGKYHIVKPMVSLTAIGAGGGSIARVAPGALSVGPESAGAEPGPACYGRGGDEPTVTDADVVLGIIDPDHFLGGELKLDKGLAEAAIQQKIAGPLGMDIEEAAAAIKTIADHQMADLLHALTIGKGYDPRDFVIFAYGGAGPTHCHAFGAELGVRSIIVPSTATVHSAYGAVSSDLHRSAILSDLMHTPPFAQPPSQFLDISRMNGNFDRLEGEVSEALVASGVEAADIEFERYLDIRYRRQVNELMIRTPNGVLGAAELDGAMALFDKTYEELYGEGAAFREAGIEIVTFRVEARGRLPKPSLRRSELGDRDAGGARVGERNVRFTRGSGPVATQVYRGEELGAGAVVLGPAIFEFPGTTVVVGPGQEARVDEWLNVVIETEQP